MMLDFTKPNISKIKNRTGYYDFYGSGSRPIYVGVSKHLRHRVESYNEKDDWSAHPTKQNLRREIKRFSIHYTRTLREAQQVEHRQKKKTNFNFL